MEQWWRAKWRLLTQSGGAWLKCNVCTEIHPWFHAVSEPSPVCMPQFSGNGQDCSPGTLPVLQHHPTQPCNSSQHRIDPEFGLFCHIFLLLRWECSNSGAGGFQWGHTTICSQDSQRRVYLRKTNAVNFCSLCKISSVVGIYLIKVGDIAQININLIGQEKIVAFANFHL